MSACEDEDGSPKYQVTRFQAIAPSRPARTIANPAWPFGASMIPPPIVLATFVEMSAPTTLNTAAIASATLGVNARVEIGSRDRVRRVVETVGVVEEERDNDDDDDERGRTHARTP